MVTATVQRYTSVSDGMGGETYTWANHLELIGTLDQLSANEVLANDRLGIVSTHIFIIFAIPDINENDRFIINNRIYGVQSVDNPMQMNQQLEITLEYTGDTYE